MVMLNNILLDINYKKSRTDLLLEFFMVLTAIVDMATSLINLTRAIVDHCAPPFLGSYFLACPLCTGPNPATNPITWIPMLVADFYFIVCIMHKGFFYPVHIVFATTGRMVDYVEIIEKR